jgi:hypothetical protein
MFVRGQGAPQRRSPRYASASIGSSRGDNAALQAPLDARIEIVIADWAIPSPGAKKAQRDSFGTL